MIKDDNKLISQGDLVGEKKTKITQDYEFIKEIGSGIIYSSGAFSKVYKARHKLSKTPRCVKKLTKKDLTEEERKKLIEEVSILKNLVTTDLSGPPEYSQSPRVLPERQIFLHSD